MSYLIPLSLMTDTNAQAIVGTPFAARALVPVLVGCRTRNLYPVVDHMMMVHERTHVFQINKIALALQALDLCIMLNALGAQSNLSASAEGIIEEWLRFFQDSWSNFQRRQILSFHDNAGGKVNNTTTAANSAILLPVINGALNTYRKAIKFVRVQLNLDYLSSPTPTCQDLQYFVPRITSSFPRP